MRIRQIKPDFFSDKALAALDADLRLFYIGLWMEADDDGYFKWDPDRIAADLYPYKPVKSRERWIGGALLRLVDSGHIRALECGQHGLVPNLPKYQVVSTSRRVTRIHGDHKTQCTHNVSPWVAMERHASPAGNGTVQGTERNGKFFTHESAHAGEADRLAELVATGATPKIREIAKQQLEKLNHGE